MKIRNAARDESGQIIVLVAILFLALVFAVALVVNTGLIFVERRAAQEAADAAALSGALRLVATGDPAATGPGSAYQSALDAAQLNGYSSDVVVHIPPQSGPNTGNTKFVEVLITSTRSSLLASDWGLTSVHARAVAGGGGSPSQAIYSLGGGGVGLNINNGGVLGLYRQGTPVGCTYDPSLAQPWVTSTTPQVDCSSFGGTAQVNSLSSSAGTSNGNPGGLIGPPNVQMTLVGDGSVPVQDSCTNVTLPDPKFPGATCANAVLPDPLKFQSKPPVGNPNWCREDTGNTPTAVCATYTGNINGCATSLVLQPGVYTGVISGNCDYIFKPGVYVFASASGGINNPNNLRVLGNTPGDTWELIAGQQGPPGVVPYVRDTALGTCGQATTPQTNDPRCGVLLFFTYQGYDTRTAPSGNGCATLSISGGNSADLAPEPVGTWSGMLVYYDAYFAGEYCAGSTIIVGGGAQVNGTSFRGLIYAPEANLRMQGNTSAAVLSQLIVNSIDVQNALVVVNVGAAQILATGGTRLTE